MPSGVRLPAPLRAFYLLRSPHRRAGPERCGRSEREDVMNTDLAMGRRDVIMAAGAGLATSLLAGATAQAQTPAAAQAAPEFWTAEYTAKKGDVSLAMYRKRIGAPVAGEPAKPVLFLVHGSSN